MTAMSSMQSNEFCKWKITTYIGPRRCWFPLQIRSYRLNSQCEILIDIFGAFTTLLGNHFRLEIGSCQCWRCIIKIKIGYCPALSRGNPWQREDHGLCQVRFRLGIVVTEIRLDGRRREPPRLTDGKIASQADPRRRRTIQNHLFLCLVNERGVTSIRI